MAMITSITTAVVAIIAHILIIVVIVVIVVLADNMLLLKMVVEKMLEGQGRSRRDIGREGFTQEVWKWKEQYGGLISQQMRSLGASCDWSRERFTLDAQLSGMKHQTSALAPSLVGGGGGGMLNRAQTPSHTQLPKSNSQTVLWHRHKVTHLIGEGDWCQGWLRDLPVAALLQLNAMI